MTTTAPQGTATRRRFNVLGANFAVLMLNYADRAVIGVAAPLMIAEFGFSTSTFGWILAAFSLTYSPFGFIGGWLADRFGARNVMAGAIAVWSAFTAMTAAGVGFISLFVIRLFFGAGEGPQATVTAKLMQDWFPKGERGSAVGIANAATPLGGAIGTPLVVALMAITNDNWRAPFIIFGALGIFAFIGWMIVVRDTPEKHPKVNADEIAHIRQDTTSTNTGDETDLAVADSDDTSESSTTSSAADTPAAAREPWVHHLWAPAVWSTALAYFGYAWILWTFLTWFPTYLVQERGIDLEGLGVAGTIPWIGGCIGLALGGVITDILVRRSGNPVAPRRHMVVVCLGITALLFGGIGLVTTVWAAVVMMTLVVLFLYLTGAQYWVIIGEVVPERCYGSVAGAVQMFATTASIFAPLATGYLVESTFGWGGTFTLAAVIALAGTVSLAIFGRTRSVPSTTP